MKRMTVEEMKERLLPILKEIDAFCRKNNIRYSLSGGTLIGVVRHKGFIPWDDDIDIMLPRPDYDKFVASFNGEHTDSKYRLISCETDRDYFQPYAKVVDTTTKLVEHYDKKMKSLGVYIDVFPIDGLPDDDEVRKTYWKKMFKRRNFMSCTYEKTLKSEKGIKKILRKIIFYFSYLFPANFAARCLNSYARKNYNFDKAKYVGCIVFGYGTKEEVPHSFYECLVDMDFEDLKVKASAQNDIYLSNIYGDYMQLPPEDQRKTRHHSEAYFL